jgi:hypothetical protein
LCGICVVCCISTKLPLPLPKGPKQASARTALARKHSVLPRRTAAHPCGGRRRTVRKKADSRIETVRGRFFDFGLRAGKYCLTRHDTPVASMQPSRDCARLFAPRGSEPHVEPQPGDPSPESGQIQARTCSVLSAAGAGDFRSRPEPHRFPPPAYSAGAGADES